MLIFERNDNKVSPVLLHKRGSPSSKGQPGPGRNPCAKKLKKERIAEIEIDRVSFTQGQWYRGDLKVVNQGRQTISTDVALTSSMHST